MSSRRLFVFVFFLALIFTSCGKDKNPTGAENGVPVSAGALSMGLDGANMAVDANNGKLVFDIVIVSVFNAFNRGHAGLASGALLAASTEVEGLSYGKAVINGTVSGNQTPATFDFTATFYNYSDDGKIYLGNQVGYSGTVNLNTQTGEVLTILTLDNEIAFTGTYRGYFNFSGLKIYADRRGMIETRGIIKVTSNDKTFDLNLYPPVPVDTSGGGPGGPGGGGL
jgi:hypothetical protein